MVHFSKVVNGIAAYIDNEIAAQLNGSYKAWVAGAAGGIIAARAGNVLTKWADSQAAKELGLIDGEMIDIESICSELHKQAQKSPATINVPLLGAITFNADDISKLQRYIMGG